MDISRIRAARAKGADVPPGWWRRAAQNADLDPEVVLAALGSSADEADALFPKDDP